MTRCFRIAGLPTASLDVAFGDKLPDDAKHTMDLTTAAGMSLLACTQEVTVEFHQKTES